MDASLDMVVRIIPPTETYFLVESGTGIPTNAVIQRDGQIVTLRDGTIVVDERP